MSSYLFVFILFLLAMCILSLFVKLKFARSDIEMYKRFYYETMDREEEVLANWGKSIEECKTIVKEKDKIIDKLMKLLRQIWKEI